MPRYYPIFNPDNQLIIDAQKVVLVHDSGSMIEITGTDAELIRLIMPKIEAYIATLDQLRDWNES